MFCEYTELNLWRFDLHQVSPSRNRWAGRPRNIPSGSNAYNSFCTDRLMTLPRNLATAFLQSSERFADNAALSVGGQETTYEDLANRAKSLGATVGKGRHPPTSPHRSFCLSFANRLCGSARSTDGRSRLRPAKSDIPDRSNTANDREDPAADRL